MTSRLAKVERNIVVTLVCKAVPLITEMNLQNLQQPLPGMLPHAQTCKSRIAKRVLRTGRRIKKTLNSRTNALQCVFSLSAAFSQTKINNLFTGSEDFKILPPFSNCPVSLHLLCFTPPSRSRKKELPNEDRHIIRTEKGSC